MAVPTTAPTGREVHFEPDEVIVSKTDVKGVITYANRVFLSIAGYTEAEVIGQPHNMIRHPDMPRSVFQLLWDTVADGREIFAYVVNMAKNGDHYWVFAHVTPTFDDGGRIVGYHSNRRVPDRRAVATVEQLYRELCAIERQHSQRKDGIQAGMDALKSKLQSAGATYDELVWSL
ncbi:MAG: PAS domain-containing protein [Sandaracinaceae bacterium]